MRLTCPNCAAQYEVPDEVIPLTGRDVQCSNCGDTWFQTHPDNPDAVPPVPDEEDLSETGPEWEEDDPAVEEPPQHEEVAEEAEPEPEYDASDAEPEPDEGDGHETWEEASDEGYEEERSAPERKPLDEDVTSVLREEAEREQQARQADAQDGLETQPDLGLSESDEVERRLQQAKARMARLRGLDAEDEYSDTPASEPEIDLGTRRNLLPEIEDVDQRLESEAEGAAEAAAARDGSRVATQEDGRSGFGRGLRLAVFLAVIAAALYIFAPQFSAMVPALEGALTAYTQIVDQARAALQAQFGGLAEQVKGMISG